MDWLRAIGLVSLATLAVSTTGTCPAQAQAAASTADDAEKLSSQGYAFYSQGKFSEAEPLYRKALDLQRAATGELHEDTAKSYNDLAIVLDLLGRYPEAELLHQKALDIKLATLGANNPKTAIGYNGVANNLNSQGRYEEAGKFYRKALEIRRATLGENHRDTGLSYNNVAGNLDLQGRYREAGPLYGKALDIFRMTLGENHSYIAVVSNNMAATLDAQGRYGEAEPLYRKALDVWHATLGENHPEIAAGYNNVALNLAAQGRYGEAEPLYRKALDIRRAALGENHPDTASSYHILATNLNDQGQIVEAEQLFRKALAIRREKLGDGHPDTAKSYDRVANVLNGQGRLIEAESLYRKSLDILRTALGESHPDTGRSYYNLGLNLMEQGRYDDADPLYRKALDIRRAALGENHPDTALSYAGVASNFYAQRRFSEAEMISAKAVESARRARLSASGQGASSQSQASFGKHDALAGVFSSYLAVAAQLVAKAPGERPRLQANAFRAAQDIIGSASAQAMADAAVRASAGTDALAAVAREEQDLAALAGQTDKKLLAALGRSDTPQAAQLRTDYEATLGKLAIVEARIDKDFPTYRELISPKPLDLADAQKALAPGEGLLVLVEGDKAVYSFAATPDAVAWNRVEGDAKAILKQIAILRCGVDAGTCSDEQKAALDAMPATKAEQDGYQRFDLVTAHALYKSLIAPLESALKGVSRLYVTSSGSLGDLPLGMLVTAPPAANADLADPDVLLNAPWLSDRYALTTLPAVSALRLRAMAKAKLKPSTAFRGYGNPVLAPTKGEDRGGTYYRGAGADGIRLGDPDRLRTLRSLPGTRIELEAMAGLYPLGTSALTMGAGATEAALKHDPLLRQTNVIAFATHGLLPSPGKGMDEPGLVFTPPKVASTDDDGILTASEASQLSFLADWVILSACNTASTASGAGGSDSLSALARAFLYAGAHALLASHWQVSDKATAALTVETLTARRDNPKLTRAQALQQAMHSVRTGKRPDGSAVKGWDQSWLHPSAWAPFSHIANSDE